MIAKLVQRFWPWLLAAWVIVGGTLFWSAPAWDSVAVQGEFNFLPENSPTRRGEELLQQAFPDDREKSNIVLVLTRNDETPLSSSEKSFITDTLLPKLEQLSESESNSPILSVRTFSDEETGDLLISKDERCALVEIELSLGFLDQSNREQIEKVEQQIKNLRSSKEYPPELNVSMTGSAVVGRDERRAQKESAEKIQSWTTWLVLGLLLVVYRAPVLALIPLCTIVFSLEISLKMTALLAEYGLIGVFQGQEIYTRVIVYGAGVDYSLFLLSRYHEEMRNGLASEEAVGMAIRKVGTAVAVSATTEIFGLGMLMFMSFLKFQKAGFSIALGFLVMLLTSLLLTPSLLSLAGRFAFWPFSLSKPDGASRQVSRKHIRNRGIVWEWIGVKLQQRPGIFWIVTVLILLPFGAWGVSQSDRLSYGIVSELPLDAPSRTGTQRLSQYFPAGKAGPVTVLIRNDEVDFLDSEGELLMSDWTDNLWLKAQQLNIADIRSLDKPKGFRTKTKQDSDAEETDGRLFEHLVERSVKRTRSGDYYVSDSGKFDGSVTRASIVLSSNPFARETIEQFEILREAVKEALPDKLNGSTVYLLGSTANLNDLKSVAEQDRTRIYLLVTVVVLVILIIMLRRVAIPIYLMLLILLGYFVTIGTTILVFQWWQGDRFVGLDWTVPIFLFTVLIAVGEDYNIFLITRVDEEYARSKSPKAVIEAFKGTGSIISGCGLIMAGTFSSLIFGGHLLGLQQLGFALVFGVLLDTFVIRTFLVPTWLTLLYEGRFGRFSRCLGGRSLSEKTDSKSVPSQ